MNHARHFNALRETAARAVSRFGCRKRFPVHTLATAHAIAGDRVSPLTMAVDDPGVGDEFNPQFSHQRVPSHNGSQTINTFDFEWDKLITPRLALSVDGTHALPRNPTARGFDNCGVGLKYLMYVNEPHEFMTSVGEASPALTTGAGQPNAFNYDFTVQYSLPYLQEHVRDIGLPQPLSNLIPLVEIPLSRSEGQTTGTVNSALRLRFRSTGRAFHTWVSWCRPTFSSTMLRRLRSANRYFRDEGEGDERARKCLPAVSDEMGCVRRGTELRQRCLRSCFPAEAGAGSRRNGRVARCG
jgi:hypothetical protein